MILFHNQTDLDAPLTYAKCPSCRQDFLLTAEDGKIVTKARNCIYCDFWIEESKIVLSGLINQTLAESLESAEVIKEFHQIGLFIILLIIIEIGLIYSVKDSFFHHLTFGFTSFILFSGFNSCKNWMKKYKDLRIYDRELLAAKKRAETARSVWGTALFVNVILWISYFILIKYR